MRSNFYQVESVKIVSTKKKFDGTEVRIAEAVVGDETARGILILRNGNSILMYNSIMCFLE